MPLHQQHPTDYAKELNVLRHQHVAWQLLASRRAPLVISCLKPLFSNEHQGVTLVDAQQLLADVFAEFANHPDFGIGASRVHEHSMSNYVSDEDGLTEPSTTNKTDYFLQAGREIRSWIKKQLIIEREGMLLATDALQRAFVFIDSLTQTSMMTSTASMLDVVQDSVEKLAVDIDTDPQSRVDYISQEIAKLQTQLDAAKKGELEVLSEQAIVEQIRTIYTLAMSLRADFRRVEDSYREADKDLRQSVIADQAHRGQVIDLLLDNHDNLLETPEGQVFHGFNLQLQQSVRLSAMRLQLKKILAHPMALTALNDKQHTELIWLTLQLTKEAQAVIKTRARSEKDVKGFIKTGLAAEHHRVGQLLNQIFEVAIQPELDWQSAKIRRTAVPLPPVAQDIALSVPVISRLRFKEITSTRKAPLKLQTKPVPLADMTDVFWEAMQTLDKAKLLHNTLRTLKNQPEGMLLSELSQHKTTKIDPSHDLETLLVWLGMARSAGIDMTKQPKITDKPDNAVSAVQLTENIRLTDEHGVTRVYKLPKVRLTYEALNAVDWGF